MRRKDERKVKKRIKQRVKPTDERKYLTFSESSTRPFSPPSSQKSSQDHA